MKPNRCAEAGLPSSKTETGEQVHITRQAHSVVYILHRCVVHMSHRRVVHSSHRRVVYISHMHVKFRISSEGKAITYSVSSDIKH